MGLVEEFDALLFGELADEQSIVFFHHDAVFETLHHDFSVAGSVDDAAGGVEEAHIGADDGIAVRVVRQLLVEELHVPRSLQSKADGRT